ncbi:MAG TPA: ester cyclase [Egibacteraceae bacterium]|nr:ester cyclase [Egibacteraceae bacterium]
MRREVEELINQGDYGLFDELIGDGYVAYDPTEPEPLRGRDAYRESLDTFRNAFPDLHVRIDEQIAEGDKVATRWTMTGRHDGDLFGIPATGRQVEVTGISIERLVDGTIVEDHMELDTLGLMRQLGAVPNEAAP